MRNSAEGRGEEGDVQEAPWKRLKGRVEEFLRVLGVR